MDYFVKPIDNLSRLINEKAEELYNKLESLPLEKLGLSQHILDYFKKHHYKRSFFSIQTAAELLYRSVKLKDKEVAETVIMDYGAGVGSLYILAKMIGCKTVIYNDIMEDYTIAAKIIAEHLGIYVDEYIAAEHVSTIDILNKKNISCDIILSRNVIEHIYDLNAFYGDMAVGQPNAIIYFSTTANYYNPAMLLFHKMHHKQYEPHAAAKRREIISRQLTTIDDNSLKKVVKATRGLAMSDLDNAIQAYKLSGTLPNPKVHDTNTCEPEHGIWYEHMMPAKEYEKIITPKGYKLTILPAFWDTHYGSFVKDLFGKIMNGLSRILGDKGGLRTTAFIYIIAEKK